MKENITLITRFFLFASGATFELIMKCPRFEVNKYASIGLTSMMFFVGDNIPPHESKT